METICPAADWGLTPGIMTIYVRAVCGIPEELHAAQNMRAETKSFKLFSGQEHIMDCKHGEDCQMSHRLSR